MPNDALADEFIKLRGQAIRLRQTINTFNSLFDSDPETEPILRESAGLFFTDLNTMMQEYAVLLVCRLTGPAESFGKANLSTQRATRSSRTATWRSISKTSPLAPTAKRSCWGFSMTCKRISTPSATPSASGRWTFGTCLGPVTSSTWSGR